MGPSLALHVLATAVPRKMAHLFDVCLAYVMKCIGKDGIYIKDEQEAIMIVYKGKDVFVWLLTGYGKSVCRVSARKFNFFKLDF